MEKATKQMDGKTILKEALQETGMKQADLAEHFGLTVSTVSQNMRRDRISLDVFVSYLNAMGYSVMVCKESKQGKLTPEYEVMK